jgi:hypothetical protein
MKWMFLFFYRAFLKVADYMNAFILYLGCNKIILKSGLKGNE